MKHTNLWRQVRDYRWGYDELGIDDAIELDLYWIDIDETKDKINTFNINIRREDLKYFIIDLVGKEY